MCWLCCQSYCYAGRCSSHESQCQLLWGDTGHQATDACYTRHNIAGDYYGNCGYNWVDETYKKCSDVYV